MIGLTALSFVDQRAHHLLSGVISKAKPFYWAQAMGRVDQVKGPKSPMAIYMPIEYVAPFLGFFLN